MAAKLGIHGLSRGIALDMARYNVRSNCISPSAWSRMIGSIPTETDAEKLRVERLKQMTPEKIAPLAVYLCSDKADGISGQIIGVRNNEIFLLLAAAPDPRAASLRRLDAGEARRAAQERLQAVAHAARALRRRVHLGSGVMAIVYDKLMALKIPDVERTYTQRDPIFYALSLGLGQDPMNADQLAVRATRTTLKVLPTFPVVVAQPGMWARELDTGIDWVKIVHGEHDLVLHKPLPPAGTVTSQTRVLDVIDKGPGKGALIFSQRKVHDKATGELLATITQTTFCRGDGGFGGPPAPRARAARAPGARAGRGLRSADAPRDGAALPLERRHEPAACRSGDRREGRLPAPDPARACDLRRCRPRDPEDDVRLRSGALQVDRRAVLRAGLSGRDDPHRDVARRAGGELPRARRRARRGRAEQWAGRDRATDGTHARQRRDRQHPRGGARAVRGFSRRILAQARPRARLSDRVRRCADRGAAFSPR